MAPKKNNFDPILELGIQNLCYQVLAVVLHLLSLPYATWTPRKP